MYEIDSNWRRYFALTDPKMRKEQLDKLLDGGDYPGYEFARTVFDNRHAGKNGEVGETDRMLFDCVVLISLYKGTGFFKKSNIKEIKKIFGQMGVNDIQTETDETLLYWEMRNALARYFETCKSSGYRRKLFGMMGASDGDKKNNMIADAWKMSTGLIEKYSLADELQLWSKAVHDEFSMLYDGANRDLEEFAL